MQILVYSDSDEIVTRHLMTDLRSPEDRFISVEALLKHIKIFDRIENGVPTLQWTLPSGEVITNSRETLLINRVLEVKRDLFQDFDEADQDYAFSEFYAYLTFALEAFPKRTAGPSAFGLSGSYFPLPYQWKKVGEHLPPVGVPEFYFGSNPKDLKSLNSLEWVRGELYSYYHWRPGNDFSGSALWYERPKGQAYSVFRVGDRFHAEAADGRGNTDRAISSLLDFAPKVFDLLELKLGEALFFVDREEISFGMACPLMKGARDVPSFSHFLKGGLEEWK